MNDWISVQSIPSSGKEFVINPTADWRKYLEEFSLPYAVDDLSVVLTLFPQADGMLARGRIQGTVGMPCTRCAENAQVALDRSFDVFEPYPDTERRTQPAAKALPVDQPARVRGAWKPRAQDKKAVREEESADTHNLSPDLEVDENVVRETPRGLEVNAATLAFEEFLLTLPVKPLCSASCRGICPQCGKNLNSGACSCVVQDADPRLEALRGFKVGKEK